MNSRELLRRRAKLFAERRSQARAEPGTPMLVFSLGSERYGLPLHEVCAVRPFAQCAPLPGAPPGLLGVMDIRGDAFSVAELGALLGLAPIAERVPGFVLVLRTGPRVGFRVDTGLDIRSVVEAQLAPMPQAVTSSRYLKGLAPDQTMILNLDALLGHPALADATMGN